MLYQSCAPTFERHFLVLALRGTVPQTFKSPAGDRWMGNDPVHFGRVAAAVCNTVYRVRWLASQPLRLLFGDRHIQCTVRLPCGLLAAPCRCAQQRRCLEINQGGDGFGGDPVHVLNEAVSAGGSN